MSQEEASLYLVNLPDERDPLDILETPVSARTQGNSGTRATAFQARRGCVCALADAAFGCFFLCTYAVLLFSLISFRDFCAFADTALTRFYFCTDVFCCCLSLVVVVGFEVLDFFT